MASPAPALVEWIAAQVSDWGDSDAEIAAALNAEMIPNPEPAPEILPPLSGMVLFEMVGTESKARLTTFVNLAQVRGEILTGQRDPLCNWIRVMVPAGIITQEEATAAITYLTTPAPDPEHPEEVPAVQAEFGRLLDAQDVAAARRSVNG